MPFHNYLHTAVVWPWKEGQYEVDGGDPVINVNEPIEIDCTVWLGDAEAPAETGGSMTINGQADVDRPLLTNSLFWPGELEDWDSQDPKLVKRLMSIAGYNEAGNIRGDDPTMIVNLKWFTGTLPQGM